MNGIDWHSIEFFNWLFCLLQALVIFHFVQVRRIDQKYNYLVKFRHSALIMIQHSDVIWEYIFSQASNHRQTIGYHTEMPGMWLFHRFLFTASNKRYDTYILFSFEIRTYTQASYKIICINPRQKNIFKKANKSEMTWVCLLIVQCKMV